MLVVPKLKCLVNKTSTNLIVVVGYKLTKDSMGLTTTLVLATNSFLNEQPRAENQKLTKLRSASTEVVAYNVTTTDTYWWYNLLTTLSHNK